MWLVTSRHNEWDNKHTLFYNYAIIKVLNWTTYINVSDLFSNLCSRDRVLQTWRKMNRKSAEVPCEAARDAISHFKSSQFSNFVYYFPIGKCSSKFFFFYFQCSDSVTFPITDGTFPDHYCYQQQPAGTVSKKKKKGHAMSQDLWS